MSRTRVRDVMTNPVVAVLADAPFKDTVRLLAGHRISGMPVVEPHGKVIGVVTEGDLLAKKTREDQPMLHMLLHRHARVARTKAAADTAGELMTAPPVTVSPDATLSDAARMMQRRAV